MKLSIINHPAAGVSHDYGKPMDGATGKVISGQL
jgi:hypothetical protein